MPNDEVIWNWCVLNTPDLGIAEEMFFGGIHMPPLPEDRTVETPED